MWTEEDDRLIQRCVDNELSREQRQRLLKRLDELPDGWKTLACSFLEDQLYGNAVREQQSISAAPLVQQPKPIAGHSDRRNWFYHPVTSLALTLCVAFLSGMLISGYQKQAALITTPGGTAAGFASLDAPSQPDAGKPQIADSGRASAPTELVGNDSSVRVRLKDNGGRTHDLPVFEDMSDFLSQYEQHLQQTRRSLPRDMEILGGKQSEVRWLRVTTDDGRTILVPVEEYQVAPQVQ